MKIALAQTNPVIGDFPHNTRQMLALAGQAAAAGCSLAVFPELSFSGYPPRDLLERPAFIEAQSRAVREFAEKAPLPALCGAAIRNPDPEGKPLLNAALLIEDGKPRAAATKRLLPSYDVFDETRYFEPGRKSSIVRFQGLRIGVTICEDIWNDKDALGGRLYRADPVADIMGGPAGPPDLLVNISASPYRMGKAAVKERIFRKICAAHRVPLLYVNQAGGQDALVFDGRSLAVNREGRVFTMADSFAEDLLVVDTDNTTCIIPPDFPESDEEAAVFDALTCGTRDYVRKCGFSKVVLGLSGGIDSAVCAVIAAMAVGGGNVAAMIMPSRYSAPESAEDAARLAKRLGIEVKRAPIDGLMAVLGASLAPVIGKIEGTLTEQNLQARLRGMLLMAVANQQNRILLTTGNKSEMAVGYCTLYGDMNGGLAVLSDVPKTMVYRLAAYVNREEEIIPARIIRRPPSAELAPDQKDSDDLPPYEVLDPILKAWVEENRSLAEIAASGRDPAIAAAVVERIFANEYKRAQAAPGLKITSKAFGYGRRYPIAHRYREGVGD